MSKAVLVMDMPSSCDNVLFVLIIMGNVIFVLQQDT